MHRLPKAARLTAVIVSLLAALLAPAVAEARGSFTPVPRPAPGRPFTADAVDLARTAPQAIKHGTTNKQCTGWRSTFQPPDTIRVLRTHGPDKGNVETVDFRTYVGWVLSTEWTSHYPLEALKVGAIAVKQYGWYYTIVYRGGVDAQGNCFDVRDNTNDQYYDPDNIKKPRPGPNKQHLAAMAATWNISLRKYSKDSGTSRLFLTGYRSGKNVPCGQERDRFRLYQRSIYNCATPPSSLSYEQILRIYLNPSLEIVSPGAHDAIGTTQGDATALAALDETTLAAHIYQPLDLKGASVASSSAATVVSQGLLASASIDMNGDGRDDLVTLDSAAGTSASVDVALSDGAAGYQPATAWWPETDLGVPVAGARLLVGDFNADSRADIGILLAVPPPPAPSGDEPPADPQAELIAVLQRKNGDPQPAVTWWSGSLDLTTSSAWAADVNGDGATDLLVGQDVSVAGKNPTPGIHFAVALSAPPLAGLASLATWYDAPDLLLPDTLETVGDLNRDGMDDLFVAYTTSGGATRIDLIKSDRKRVARLTLWTAGAADPMPLAKLKLQSADLNFDGHADLILYRSRGENGTSLVALRSTYKKLKAFATLNDSTLDWSSTIPY